MKLSVSLPQEDVTFLDKYAQEQGIESRSAALHVAVKALRHAELVHEYEEAFLEWNGSEDAKLWDSTSGDGIEGQESWWDAQR